MHCPFFSGGRGWGGGAEEHCPATLLNGCEKSRVAHELVSALCCVLGGRGREREVHAYAEEDTCMSYEEEDACVVCWEGEGGAVACEAADCCATSGVIE